MNFHVVIKLFVQLTSHPVADHDSFPINKSTINKMVQLVLRARKHVKNRKIITFIFSGRPFITLLSFNLFRALSKDCSTVTGSVVNKDSSGSSPKTIRETLLIIQLI